MDSYTGRAVDGQPPDQPLFTMPLEEMIMVQSSIAHLAHGNKAILLEEVIISSLSLMVFFCSHLSVGVSIIT